jgi:hypothetical protein
MRNHIERTWQRHDGIPSELSWSVPSDASAAVHVDDRCAVGGSFPRLGAPAGGVNRFMLEKQHSVYSLAGDPRGMQSTL